MPLIFIFAEAGRRANTALDGDTGWHIRTGEWILAHHQVPHVDLFSFSRPGAPWFAWEWLWDVLFALLHQRWGLAAVVLASLAVICLTTAWAVPAYPAQMQQRFSCHSRDPIGDGGLLNSLAGRPHLFTLLFFVVTLHITERAAEGRTHLLAWLVPLTLVWTNMHGGFFVVFLVLACYIGSDLLNALIEPDALLRRGFLRNARPWLVTFGACFPVTFINPYGWGLHQHVFQYITDPYQLQHIAEFQALNFHSPAVVLFRAADDSGLADRAVGRAAPPVRGRFSESRLAASGFDRAA